MGEGRGLGVRLRRGQVGQPRPVVRPGVVDVHERGLHTRPGERGAAVVVAHLTARDVDAPVQDGRAEVVARHGERGAGADILPTVPRCVEVVDEVGGHVALRPRVDAAEGVDASPEERGAAAGEGHRQRRARAPGVALEIEDHHLVGDPAGVRADAPTEQPDLVADEHRAVVRQCRGEARRVGGLGDGPPAVVREVVALDRVLDPEVRVEAVEVVHRAPVHDERALGARVRGRLQRRPGRRVRERDDEHGQGDAGADQDVAERSGESFHVGLGTQGIVDRRSEGECRRDPCPVPEPVLGSPRPGVTRFGDSAATTGRASARRSVGSLRRNGAGASRARASAPARPLG